MLLYAKWVKTTAVILRPVTRPVELKRAPTIGLGRNVPPPVDLVVQDIVLTPANPKTSDTVYIDTKIKNQGTAFAYFPATDPGKVFEYFVNGRPYSGQGAISQLGDSAGRRP